ncbi:MAG: prepilin-type N-terminal cleavage/methylation domain-containing protein [Nitrospirae bacterium]|nr:prepilin-type N-terminal cleavage/methylation domain-containing protein [Nitrospirota bacterium]
MRPASSHPSVPYGFTLIELLIGMALTVGIVAALSHLFLSQQHQYNIQNSRAEMWQSLFIGLEFLEREIRLAGYGLSPGETVLTIREEQTLELHLDPDDDGENNSLSYRFNANRTQLQRRVDNGPWSPLVEQVIQLSFSYLTGDGQSTEDPSEVRQIGIRMTVQASWRDSMWTENGGYRTLSMNRIIPLRNIL